MSSQQLMSRSPRKKQPERLVFKYHYAGFVTRLVAFILDILVVTLSISLLWATLALIARFFSIPLFAFAATLFVGVASLFAGLFGMSAETFLAVIVEAEDIWRAVGLFFTGFGFTFVTSLVYNIFFWMLAGKTLGKAVMGIRVVGPRGARMTFGRSLRRALAYWLSALPMFLGFLWVLITEERTGWHDRLAGTRVIYDYEARYSDRFLGRLARLAPKLEAKRTKLLRENDIEK